MLKLEFSAQDMAQTRFARSPLWEVVTSVQSLKDPKRHVLHANWSRSAGRELKAAGVDFALLSALVPIPSFYVPDFLTPVPHTAAPSIEEELAGVAATPPAVLRADLERLPHPWHPFVTALHRHPEAGLERLVAEIQDYWRVALLPHWPRITRLLDGEVLHRSWALAQGGAAALFQGLHAQVSWEHATLRVAHPAYEATRVLDTGHGLVLVPSVFVWPGVFTQSSPPGQAGLVYPPRAVGELWSRSGQPVASALTRVIGRSRARLLTQLAVPASTFELSDRLGMSAPNVSHHLTVLREAGLVTAHRAGHSVLYLRTPAADTLIAASEPG
ncbi:transcriptional regulator [Actinoplanes capillaceus]|uniref:Transcriptional regulator n=1 Tax=Actinoplanes campanulatus TaxID=113559 RepID=A0ABQ3WUM7_9ACTN|nr:metalloregulator ArsR/SmtB family transcription factor [Actinoplanes capillaceus]GID49996.1 transcriptional regulator [Actinoplanes capillaceus]